MDRLARNAMLARQAGMSYGKWKALQPRIPVEKMAPENWIECEWCGKPFRPRGGKRFCDLDCRDRAYRARKYGYTSQAHEMEEEAAKMEGKRKPQFKTEKVCLHCGKTFVGISIMKFCCRPCGDAYRYRVRTGKIKEG